MHRKPSLSIVIVNWNGERFLKDCFDSLHKQTCKDFEVIMIDNGSKDNSVNLANSYKGALNLRIIKNKDNLGFAQPNNQGVRAAQADYCLLLNNDTIAYPKFIEDILSELKLHNYPALFGIDPLDRNGHPASTNDWTMSVLLTNMDKSKTKEQFYYSGCSEVLDKTRLGEPFDGDYFLYGEDTSLSWRARLMGLPLAFTTKPKVKHLQSSTSKRVPDYVAYYSQRNRIMNFFIFYSTRNLILLSPLFALSLIVQTIYEAISAKASVKMRLKAYWWVISNFRKIMQKRRKMQALRKVGDGKITRKMTGRVLRGNGWAISLVNSFSGFYCNLLNIRTMD